MTKRRKLMRNAAFCNVCMTEIESLHVHDFRTCKCPPGSDTQIFVDGGHDYQRMGFGDRSDYTRIIEEYVPQGPVQLENSDVILRGVHHPSRCQNEYCTVHNRSNHSKRSWVQHWNGRKGIMERISPTTGRHYRDPDEP